jgi:wyosine [tRNA(Phe)-imidazoG37] synthetase (radical SAM superfamily)
LVLITNASMLHRPRVRQALETIDRTGGEIWAKLDAGTEDYYRTVNRSPVPFRQVLENLREAAIGRPVVIQSLFARTFDEPPSADEQESYCDRLNEITAAGGRIKLVQVHTVARVPAESWVAPLKPEELTDLADRVRRRTGLNVEMFGA